MMIGTALSSASASWRGALVDFLHHALLVLELVDRVLQLLVQHHAIGDDDDAVEDAARYCRRAVTPAGASASQSCCSCRSRPNARRDSYARRLRLRRLTSDRTAWSWW